MGVVSSVLIVFQYIEISIITYFNFNLLEGKLKLREPLVGKLHHGNFEKRDISLSSAFAFFFSTYSNCFFLFLWNKDSLKQSKKKNLFFIPTPIKIIFIYLSFYSFYSTAVSHSLSFSKTRLSDSHRPLLTHLSTSFIPLPFHHRRLDSSSFLPIFEAQLRSSIIHHPHRRPHAPSPTRFVILLTHL